VSSEITLKAKEFLDYIRKSKSESTLKIYKRGLDLFSEYYGKSLDEILKERREDMQSGGLKQRKKFAREIEIFHKWLLEEKGYPLNSAGSYSQGIMQLFRYFEMAVTISTSSDVWKRHLTTKDFVPKPEQYREMYRVADNLRDKLIVSMGLSLAWRIGDFIKIRKDQLPNLERTAPIPFELITEKEDVIAKSFLSNETVELLKDYLRTLPEDNPYLFPSVGRNGKKGYMDDWTVNLC
jgi:integrase